MAVTFAPLKVIAVSVLDLISLPLTVRVPPTDTLAASKVIAVVPIEDCISLPPTLMSPEKAVRVLEVRVMLVTLSDALISLPPTVMSPGKLVLPEASKSVRVLSKVPKGVPRPVVVYCLT